MSIETLENVKNPLEAGLTILGSTLIVDDISLRIVEVEAYGGEKDGPWPDPAAHSYRGQTPRNSVMFGRAGRLYVYRSYGMHFCMNISYGPDGVAGGVLLRAAEIEAGHDVVSARRSPDRPSHQWARGPGNLGASVAITLADNGTDVFNLLRGFGSNWGSRRSGSVDRGWGSVLRPRSRGASGFRTRELCPRTAEARERRSFREDGMIESVTENILDELTWRG
ncbi:hypothetical protein N806_15150 [Rhodococcus sp. P27]|nr:hypothetical protein N806_15150 [Rhodococcus sp. P27]